MADTEDQTPTNEGLDDLDAAFEVKKKKKKSSKKSSEEGGEGEGGAVDDEMDAMFAASKKKSKKKKDKEASAEEPTAGEGDEAAVDDDEMDAMFSGKKSKKKKSKEVGVEEGEGAGSPGGEEGDGDEVDFDFGSKKSKKKKSKAREEVESPVLTEANYSYDELLQRVQVLLQEGDPSKAIVLGRVPIKMPTITLVRIGTKKTRWDNFQEICKCMNRTLEHLFQFVVAELGTEGSIDGNNRLVLRGKYVPKGIESLLRKYVGEYVACTTCRSPNTTLTRDSVSRLYFVHCQSCGSSRSVAPIRTGFHAQTRADRRAQRK